MGELKREDRGGGGEDDRPVRSQATDGEQLGRESLREQWEWCRVVRSATVTAHLTQKHAV